MATVRRLLIVDDETAILFAFSQFLKSPSMLLETAETPEAAYSLIESRIFDAALVDLRLTGAERLEGLDIVGVLRQRFPQCVIIVVTAFGGDRIQADIRKAGADFYFEKPVSPEKIKETLTRAGIY